jgi:hypothetical protein
MTADQTDPLVVHNGAGRLVIFSKETGAGVRIELKRRLVIVDPSEARQIGRWLLEAAESMEPERTAS